ncbi:lipid A biosynthesis lauroyl acyltransferase [Amorphus orientalis]|uniref:KDO2-lipid IV(A) lauroyltransferase n=1 Tax=Amorphus orientalis TaxID=649198 RepID=A0AAE3VPM3_9HYPH|nr:lipid A biosynthesis lauroyl acyltransferase [Amorphus orientalis]MDQ0316509.1 KDO2-lipid IV(A) lauroyltransferase [Amorphus orientalis]
MLSRRALKARTLAVADWLFAKIVVGLVRVIRLLPARSAIDFGGWAARTVGPLLPVDKVGLENLEAAYPEMAPEERRRILNGVWDNLGRTSAEFLFLDKVFDFDFDNPTAGHFDVNGIDQFLEIRDSETPCIVFTAHMANWELLPVCAATFGLDVSVLFRPLNNARLARELDAVRGGAMGGLIPSQPGAVAALDGILARGGHIGMLVDQRFGRGLTLPFFGLPAKTNPLLAKLARRHNCNVYAARTVRMPEGRFYMELHGPIDLPRDGDGEVDVEGTMRHVNAIIEGWVREFPDQWLWLHRRWRV